MADEQCDYFQIVATETDFRDGGPPNRWSTSYYCVYPKEHGGGHFCPRDGADHSDAIRVRVALDKRDAAEARAAASDALARELAQALDAVVMKETCVRGCEWRCGSCEGCRTLKAAEDLTERDDVKRLLARGAEEMP
jgi:hypothetical protein